MNRAVLLLLVSLLAGLAAFYGARFSKVAGQKSVLLDSMPELSWMKSELKLSDEQFQKVSELHTAYRPQCTEMCGRISQAHENMEALVHENPAMTPALEKAIHKHAVIHAECQEAMLRHIFQTASVMDPSQAARYIKEMLPFALDFSHSEPNGSHGS
jgi:Spy/CpxP family protein refolding chaperone